MYITVKELDDLIPENLEQDESEYTVWFDGAGKVLKIRPRIQNMLTPALIEKNNWWHTVNEIDSDSLTTPDYVYLNESQNKYLFSKLRSGFGNIECLTLRNHQDSKLIYREFASNFFSLAVIIQLLILSGLGIIFYQREKRKSETNLYNVQADELSTANTLLETRTSDLLDTNEKLNKLTNELTHQKQDLLHLNQNLQRLQKYLNFLSIPVITVTEDFKIDFVNRATESEFGQPVEKITGNPLLTLIKTDKISGINSFMEKVKSSQQRAEMDITLSANNNLKNYLLICDYLNLPDWKGYILTLTDLTELLTLQRNISLQNHFLNHSSQLISNFLNLQQENQILKNSLNIIKKYTKARGILFYQVENGLLSLKEKITAGFKNVPDKLSPTNSITSSTLHSGQPLLIKNKNELPRNNNIIETDWKFKSAIFKPVIINKESLAVIIVIDPEKEIFEHYDDSFSDLLTQFEVGFHAYISHIELKNKNKELDESAKYRTQLLRSITHGINTPLSTIRGYTKLLKIKYTKLLNKNIELNEYLTKLDIATENIAKKSASYLDLARLNRHDLKLDEQEINIADFIKNIKDFVRDEANTRSIYITLTEHITDDLCFRTDPERIAYAVNTLLLNALRYAPQGDQVKLGIESSNDSLTFELEDHGPEIKKENIKLVGSEFLPASLLNERIHSEDNLSISLAVKLINYVNGSLYITSDDGKTKHLITIPLTEKKVYEKTG